MHFGLIRNPRVGAGEVVIDDLAGRLLLGAERGQDVMRSEIEPRDGAWVAEPTGLLSLTGWPPGTRLILPQATTAPRRAATHH